MDTYVRAVTKEKRDAQSKVVKMLFPGIQKSLGIMDVSGRATEPVRARNPF